MTPQPHSPPRFLLASALVACAALAPPTAADWPGDGNLVYEGGLYDWPGHDPALSVGTTVCPDGDGGLICALVAGPWPLRGRFGDREETRTVVRLR